ncbi:MAG TPA: class I adenylate-forming enzyme family protein [Pseudonocardiaceae bacterium]
MRPVPPPDVDPARAEAFRRAGLWGRPALAATLEAHAAEAPSRLAVVDTFGARLDYGTLAAAVRAAASWFAGRGVRPGDAVAVALPNCADYVVAHLALSRLGAATVLLSAREGVRDIAHAVAETDAVLLLLADTPRLAPAHADRALAHRAVRVTPGGASGWPGWSALAAAEVTERRLQPVGTTEGAFQPHLPGDEDVELVVFSSGTTGRPKGIAHTYRGALASLYGWCTTLGLTWRDVVFCPATFGHVGGAQWGLRTAVTVGAPLVLMDRWDAAQAARLIGEHGCTYTLVTATYVLDLMALPESLRALTRGFRLWAVGGSRMSPTLAGDAERLLGGRLLRGFGMSECFMVTITRPDDPDDARSVCDGRALPGCELAVWGDDDRPLPPGTPGELVVRGPSQVGGYFTDPEESARTFVGGWQRTGDVAVLDERGFLSVVDRRKEIIIRGGENISPQELEHVLRELGGLPPLAVVSVPDERLGERVALLYEGPPGAVTLDDLHRMLADRGLARYKWPELVAATDELPRTSLGKLQRGQVRRLAARLLGTFS